MRKSNLNTGNLDPLIHEPARLMIVSVLNECSKADFAFLLNTTGLTRGNMSVHASRLIDASYVDETKEFLNRRPHTEYALTEKGRRAFKEYKKRWRAMTSA